MSIIRIARHGETTWNAVGRYQGRLETPLSPLGQAQARALSAALRETGIRRIISSPLSRCVQTAIPLASATGVSIEIEPLLTEIAHGTWEGRYRTELAQTDPVTYYEWREHPERVHFVDGESLQDVHDRWVEFVQKFDPSEDSLFVTHDIIVRLAVLERTGRGIEGLRTVRALNAAYAEFSVEEGTWELLAECVGAHLAGLRADPERQAL